MLPAIKVPLYQDSLVFNLSADCFVDAGSNQDGTNLEEYPRKADTETTTPCAERAPAESSSHHVTSPTFWYSEHGGSFYDLEVDSLHDMHSYIGMTTLTLGHRVTECAYTDSCVRE